MHLSIQALARSAFPLPQGQEYRLHSRFSQVINLQDPQGKLLTLHRFGKGCGPRGWVFRSKDFDRLAELLTTNSLLHVDGEYLTGYQLRICARRKLDLSLPCYEQIFLPDLSFCQAQTGIVGPVTETNHPLLNTLREGITLWQAGGKPDWCNLIGLGPGLTPAGDDMLVGAMAVLYTNVRLRTLSKSSPLLPPFDQLALLTTSVSCTFLDSATLGYFSTPLLRLLQCLATGRDCRSAIDNLITHGHTSGADTLVGLMTALRWIKETEEGGGFAGS